MFIRCRPNSSKTKWTLMVCRSIRKGSKVSQEIVKYLGVAHDEIQRQTLMNLGKAEIKNLSSCFVSDRTEEDLCCGALLGNMQEVSRGIDGFHDIFGTVLDKIHLRNLLPSYKYERLKDIIVSRIGYPSSKRHTAEILSRDYQKPLTSDQIYRLMDSLLPIQEEIVKCVFEASKFFSQKKEIDILFFDVTTLHFESQIADELRDFGYSKDHKIGEVQVVLALATTSEGLPLGYTLFPGKTAEVTTLLACLGEWRKTLNIQNATVVADRAMLSEKNLLEMKKAGLKYVVAAKLKSLSQAWKKKILERAHETQIEVSGDCMHIQEHAYGSRRLIVSYSESRANKDRGDRERLLSRIYEKSSNGIIKEKRLITNRGFLKYFNEKIPGEMILDKTKIIEEGLWDGIHGIVTNETTETAKDLLERYRRLWVIEESFRINKHTLEMRPIFHFKPRRIKSHILICYLAYAISRYTQLQVTSFQGPISIERLRAELGRIESSILEDKKTGERYKISSSLNAVSKNIYKAVGVSLKRHPKKLINNIRCSGKQKIDVLKS